LLFVGGFVFFVGVAAASERHYVIDYMIPTDELNEFALPDGGRIVAGSPSRSGIPVIRFDSASRELARFELKYPTAGFVGGGWVNSPSGNLLILSYYSGQSEEAFALLDVSNGGLRLVASPEYESGECASYAFSLAEDKMIVALPRTCTEWWASWVEDGLEVADDGVEVMPFATLLLCSIDSGQIRRTELELAPEVPEPLDTGEYNPDLAPHLSGECGLAIQLPWGRVSLDLSKAPSRVRVPYPSASAIGC